MDRGVDFADQDGPPTSNSGVAAPKAFGAGADDGIRTRDLRFTKPLLYQLSYIGNGEEAAKDDIPPPCGQEPMAAND
jgi:hypothetical protein